MGPPAASNNLWVGNLASDVGEADLMELFSRYGALDSVTAYTSRSYAFVFFKRSSDAVAAKEALQGFSLRGGSLKIEFARPAKPCRQLWVGGISSTVMKEDLEEAFMKFGKIEDFKFIRDRNTAFIEFSRLEDASQAMRSMNGKRLGSDQLRVDFLRSQPSRREQWPDSRDAQFQGRSMGPGPADLYSVHNRHQYSTTYGEQRGEGQPSKVLWIGFPPNFQIDERMLHNAMILFGEIEKIKSFPSRNYSLVEFRSVDEARRAKEGLQGRLFNDSRISIMFSSRDLVPGKDLYSGGNEQGLDPVFNEHALRPLQMELYGPNRTMISNSFPGPVPTGGVLSPNMRPFGSHGRFERGPVPELNDIATHPHYQEGNLASNWRRPSPPSLSPGSGVRMHPRSASSTWDADINQFQRDSKRSRIDGPMSTEDNSFPLRKIDDQGFGLDHSYGLGDGASGGSFSNVHGKNRLSPDGLRGSAQIHPDNDYIWRGIIAKGGTPVCCARCVPIGKGVGSELPEVVNCSARTGLDMLTKHYAEAIGFEIVFFLPDSEDDFASYTEFLHYLGAKNRAGVAKFEDGTTLFLVPPSEFLTSVLKVTGPERLYGVVLKFPQVSGITSSQQQYADRPQSSTSQVDYGVMPMDYSRILSEEPKLPPKPHFPQPVEPQDYVCHNNIGAVSQTRLPLTPELIASLSSLLPVNSQSETAKSSGSASDHMLQLGNRSGQNLSQLQSYPAHHGATQFQDSAVTQSLQSRHQHNNYSLLPQPGITPHHADTSGFYNPPVPQQTINPPSVSSHSYSSNSVQSQSSVRVAPEKVNPEVSNQVQKLQSAIHGSGQGSSDGEVEKNQRYQSTLQFAANLLLQIQQQQQVGAQAERGSGNQQ